MLPDVQNMGEHRGLGVQLSFVFPPMTNQEAEHLKTDAAFKAILSTSDFYMICMHAEVTWSLVQTTDRRAIRLSVETGGTRQQVTIDVARFLEVEGIRDTHYEIYCTERHLLICSENDPDDVLAWLTPERLIWERSRQHPAITDFDRWRDFARYRLLYVGIAKESSTFDRLLAKGHERRQEILSNEYPSAGARVTDEVVIFALSAAEMGIRILSEDSILSSRDDENAYAARHRRVIADAEKAFISTLDPKYNREKYGSYPVSKDGLYGQDFDTRTFALAENYSLLTDFGDFKGGANWIWPNNQPLRAGSMNLDVIVVRGEEVVLVQSSNGQPHETVLRPVQEAGEEPSPGT